MIIIKEVKKIKNKSCSLNEKRNFNLNHRSYSKGNKR